MDEFSCNFPIECRDLEQETADSILGYMDLDFDS